MCSRSDGTRWIVARLLLGLLIASAIVFIGATAGVGQARAAERTASARASIEGAAAGDPGPVVGIAGTPDGKGYWLVATDGAVFALGDATFAGSEGGAHILSPASAMAATPDGKGY